VFRCVGIEGDSDTGKATEREPNEIDQPERAAFGNGGRFESKHGRAAAHPYHVNLRIRRRGWVTATVTSLALLLLAIGTGEAGREIEGPLAIVILGGLITLTLLNLLVLPTLTLR
jgi:hypothetical protein